MNKEKLKKEWLFSNSLVAFAGASLMVMYSQIPDGGYKLTSDATAEAFLSGASVLLFVLLLGLSFVLGAASLIQPIRSWTLRKIRPRFSPLLNIATVFAFILSWLTAYFELPRDQLLSLVLFWSGTGMLVVIFIKVMYAPLKSIISGLLYLFKHLFGALMRTSLRDRVRNLRARLDSLVNKVMSIKDHLRDFRSLLLKANPISIDGFMYVIGVVVGFIAFIAVVLWFLAYFSNNDKPDIGAPLFTLAQVMAIFGGFGFVAGFSGHRYSQLKNNMRYVGALHLISALGFSLLGMMLPISTGADVKSFDGAFLVALSIAAFLMAAVGFTLGTILWVSQLHKLMGYQNPNDEQPDP